MFRDVDRPAYDDAVNAQMKATKEKLGEGDLEKLFNTGDTWEVK